MVVGFFVCENTGFSVNFGGIAELPKSATERISVALGTELGLDSLGFANCDIFST